MDDEITIRYRGEEFRLKDAKAAERILVVKDDAADKVVWYRIIDLSGWIVIKDEGGR